MEKRKEIQVYNQKQTEHLGNRQIPKSRSVCAFRESLSQIKREKKSAAQINKKKELTINYYLSICGLLPEHRCWLSIQLFAYVCRACLYAFFLFILCLFWLVSSNDSGTFVVLCCVDPYVVCSAIRFWLMGQVMYIITRGFFQSLNTIKGC